MANTAQRYGLGALAIIGLAVLIALPYLIDAYWLRITTGAIMWAGLACAWNIVGGYAGYISFGHSAFFGLGAYATAILMQANIGLPFFATLPVGLAAAALVAALIGAPTMRLRGSYFAIATWAFAEMLLQLIQVLDITGGALGLSVTPYLNEFFFYYVMLGAALASFALAWITLERSRFGFRLKALRDNEGAAEAMGINTTLTKVQALVLSAAMTAFFGSIYAYWVTFINPESAMGGHITDQMVVMALLGGLGTVVGPAIGAVLLWFTNRFVWATWGDTTIYIPVLGLIIMGVVLFLPNGLISLWPSRRKTNDKPRRTGLLASIWRKL